ncbi:MAG: hypothetical protein ACM3SY_07010, partial [Candidatus Omnitrophota bacterium]
IVISGRVTCDGIGLADVKMEGVPADTYTDENGYYSVIVPYGWSGTVKPSKEYCTFTPVSRTYTNVMSPKPNENYTAIQKTFTLQVINEGVLGYPLKGNYTYKGGTVVQYSYYLQITKEPPLHYRYVVQVYLDDVLVRHGISVTDSVTMDRNHKLYVKSELVYIFGPYD